MAERLVENLVAVEDSLELLRPVVQSPDAQDPHKTPPSTLRLKASGSGIDRSRGGSDGTGASADFLFGSPSARLPIQSIASSDLEDDDDGDDDEADDDGDVDERVRCRVGV